MLVDRGKTCKSGRSARADWCEIATVLRELKNARIGLMGHVYEGMLDMNSDPTMFDAYFGMHVEHIEMNDLKKRIDSVTKEDEETKMKKNAGEMPKHRMCMHN